MGSAPGKSLFVAEVSSNHAQRLDRCKAFIDTAANIGCWGVKFQLFKIDELFSREILDKSPAHRHRKKWELPVGFIPKLAEHCRNRNIRFGCTPFYLNAVNELFDYVDFYKVASYELLWEELLHACARTEKPLMVSTGMATITEVVKAVNIVASSGCRDLTLLHCVSGYPAPVSDCNLAAIETLKNTIGYYRSSGMRLRFGWSDHSVNPGVIFRAINRWNAQVIEFHLDIDGKGEEFSSGHCWLPGKIAQVIQSAKDGLTADGTGVKEPTPAELPDREWRADPYDGLRPLRQTRKCFNG